MNSQSGGENEKLNSLLDEYFEERLRLFTLEASALGDHRYDDVFPNYISEEHRRLQQALYSSCRIRVLQIDANLLSDQDRLSYEMFLREMSYKLETLVFMDQQGETVHDHLIPIHQFWSVPMEFVQMASGQGSHRFESIRDYENFIRRIHGFSAWIDTAIENMRRGMAERIVAPVLLIEKSIAQFSSLVEYESANSILFFPARNVPPEIASQDRENLSVRFCAAMNDIAVPAFRKLLHFMKTEYLPNCTSGDGLCALPEGEQRYEKWVRFFTTTGMTADEIYQIGLQEVDRIRTEMERLKKELGFKGSLQAFFEYVKTDPEFYPFRTEEEVLDAYRSIVARIEPFVHRLFRSAPRAKLEIRATEKFRADSASEEYRPGTADGSRPGTFYVPIPDPRRYHSIRMETIFLHEAIPGHHYQMSLQQELTRLPRFRRFAWYSAFGEGWGLYAEELGHELGLYRDPYQYFGMLTQEMHRAIRLVVDPGIHAKGWSREQAIQYSLENEGIPEAQVAAEVERYMAMPAQALSYKIGQMRIRKLKDTAIAKLGADFDPADFHQQVLESGCLPLDLLEVKISHWIRKRMGLLRDWSRES